MVRDGNIVFQQKKQNDDDSWDDFDDWDNDRFYSNIPRSFIVAISALLLFLCATTLLAYLFLFVKNDDVANSSVTQVSTLTVTAARTPSTEPVAATLIITQPTITTVETIAYDPTALAAYMVVMVNQARVDNGLSTVEWDETAAEASRRHAEDMVVENYFSHWNKKGLGPEHRYMLVDGEHVVMENLHAFSYIYDDGSGAPIEDWKEVIRNAHDGLMNSPGHYANIMNPAHTHVGIGMAYDPETGQFRLAQEFTNQYVEILQPIPSEVEDGEIVLVSGRIANNNISNILLDLSYEPFPSSMTIEELDATSTYSSVAESVKTVAMSAKFDEQVVIGGGPGFYHIRIFGDLLTGQALLMDRVVVVR